MKQVLDILTLQELDDEAAGLRSSLSHAELRLAGNAELAAARDRVAELDRTLEGLAKAQRAADGVLQSASARLATEEAKLYGGSIKNPKELLSLEHEVELLRGQRDEAETRMLEVMGDAETAGAERSKAGAHLDGIEKRWETESAGLRTEVERLQQELTRVEARREGEKTKIQPRSLALYESIRLRKGGQAVARVRGSTCSACRMSIPDAVRRRIMASNDIVQCPNCDRILLVG